MRGAKLVFADIETTRIEKDGSKTIFPKTVHYITAKINETKEVVSFGPDIEDLRAGARWLETCETVVFHNGINFDEIVLKTVLDFDRTKVENLWDSVVLLRLFYSDLKERIDYRLYERHLKAPPSNPGLIFTGDLIGSHSLEAWGLRLKNPRPKGDYAAKMAALGVDPWDAPHPEMLPYAKLDVEILHDVWHQFIKPRMTEKAMPSVLSQHFLAEVMRDTHISGIHFNVEHAKTLAAELEARLVSLEQEIQAQFPPRLEPLRWVFKPHRSGITIPEPYATTAKRLLKDIDTEKKNLTVEVSEDDTEEDTRDKQESAEEARLRIEALTEELHSIWDDHGITHKLTPLMQAFPGNPIYRPRFTMPPAYVREMWGEETTPKANRKLRSSPGEPPLMALTGAPYVKVALTPFNPGSRPQIIRKLLDLGWSPTAFTKTGNPSTTEPELLKIAEQFPVAGKIVMYLLIQKRLGAIKSGSKAWLNMVDKDGIIHPRTTTSATVFFRSAHSSPNISQVASVKVGPDGKPLKGEAGKWGWDSRKCFGVPQGWTLIGADQSGIELRCWGHYLWPYDGGKLANIILTDDIHESNRKILGFAQRRDAKTFLYALIYGGSDEKLGSIILPTGSSYSKKHAGSQARARFMAGVEGFESLDRALQREGHRGYLEGLDGRLVPVRKKHALLNGKLQSAGAITAEYWIRRFIEKADALGLKWGYGGDYVLMIHSHDEVQVACRRELSEVIQKLLKDGAREAGEILNFRLPIDIGIIVGDHWGDTH